MTATRPRGRLALALTAAGLTAAGCLTVAPAHASPADASPAAAHASPASAADPDGINGYRAVGYVMADSPVTRDVQIADLAASGAIDDLTHLNYAFGNVTADLRCDILDEPGEGDAENDFLRLVSAADSVDGVADTADQALAGNFNQLRKLKAEHPDLKILISLGGWTWSDHFSEAAATPERRTALIDSCIGLYLDGDLPVIDGRGGPGAAAGIFDGIDIDWEWPVTGGETPNADPADKENFLALMEEFRTRLDARGDEDGRDYLLTAFAPAGGWNAGEGGWLDPRLFAAVDYLNVQGYDFHGGWVPNQTGHQGNLHPDGTNNWGLGLDGAMGMYVDAGARPDQLNAGLAAYGHGWYGVENTEEAWQPAAGYIGTKTYAELHGTGTAHFDPEIGASWLVDGDEWWSYDDPASVTAKAEWLAEQGYGGAMWWDLSGDFRGELGASLADTLRAATPGPAVDAACAAPWYGTGVYDTGDVVSHDGVEYRASWWTRAQQPGGANGPWSEIGPCGTAGAPEPAVCAAAWDANRVYTGGDRVSRAGVLYTAQWWTTGERPGSVAWGSWKPLAPCA
ncbi:glycosyl hydrolase family 18 protein [Agromyces archimandritae]|uniref:chitinase n=1 Tax=Agromyces archimandritae TaxID=2781962 RepID=A0A975FLG8_9MICO|nr:glycosyl hydrolase family 18 protein [Agromyces archimandritae]QTX04285.1 chitinase [Agromyces archimandritae]